MTLFEQTLAAIAFMIGVGLIVANVASLFGGRR